MNGRQIRQNNPILALPRLPGEESTATLPSGANEQSVLQKIERRNFQRRRKPPIWALKIARGIDNAKHLLLKRLPELIKRRQRELTTLLASFFIHLFGALLLMLWLLPSEFTDSVFVIVSGQVEDIEIEDPIEVGAIVQPEELKDLNLNSTVKQMMAELDEGRQRNPFDSLNDRELQILIEDINEAGDVAALKGNFDGRTAAGRRAAVKKFGGTVESENSVNLGLKWIQSIQRTDGSWSFGDVGGAGSPGWMETTDVGATSLALLCLLGGSHTHQTPGPYQKTVANGLSWLMQSGIRSSGSADMRGAHQGNSGMYVQGLATICLCEASAMVPKDVELRRIAREAARFIERSQGRDGGWRYQPQEIPGDTSVVGWQVMALQSAKAGGITVHSDTFSDARKFLNSVQAEDGVYYGYTEPEARRATTTAVGLLCRMYLGWRREKPQLKKGIEFLSELGPSREDIYYNYYATQVLYHWNGELWKSWNQQMREQLVATQVTEGPGAGSWDVTDPHGASGGRLYQTALSILTLEVYYRHLPIYRRFDSDEKTSKDSVSAVRP